MLWVENANGFAPALEREVSQLKPGYLFPGWLNGERSTASARLRR
jgi:hypothetical protein